MDKEPTECKRAKRVPVEIQIDESLSLKELAPDISDEYYELLDRNRDHLTKQGDFAEVKDATLQSTALELAEKTDNVRLGIYESGELVGRLDLIPYEDGNVGVGYWLDEASQGRGIMARSLQAAIDYAREQMGAKAIWAGVSKGNDNSKDLLLKQGFQLTEDLNHYERFKLEL